MANGNSTSAISRSLWLDLLRAVAIVLVLLRHGVGVAEISAPSSSLLAPAYNLAWNGWLGVDIFFVLSGYLLSRQILLDFQSERYSARVFMFRRIMRTGPAFGVVLLVLWLGFLDNQLATRGVREPLVLLTHVFFLQDYFPPTVLITSWSLATEEKFYLLMAILVPLIARLRPAVACMLVIGAIGLVIGWRSQTVLSTSVDNYSTYFWSFRAPFHFAIDGLLLGVLGGLISVLWPRWPGLQARTAGALVAVLLLLLCATRWTYPVQPSGAAIAAPLVALTVFGMVLAAPFMDQCLRGHRLRLVQFLARTSFSVYLVHYPVAQLIYAAFGNGTDYWLAYLTIALGLGWMLYRLIELPGMRLRDMIAPREPAVTSGEHCARDARVPAE